MLLANSQLLELGNTRRGYVFPARQLDDRNRPLAGLDCVTGLFADGYAAWVCLTTVLPSLDGAVLLSVEN